MPVVAKALTSPTPVHLAFFALHVVAASILLSSHSADGAEFYFDVETTRDIFFAGDVVPVPFIFAECTELKGAFLASNKLLSHRFGLRVASARLAWPRTVREERVRLNDPSLQESFILAHNGGFVLENLRNLILNIAFFTAL